MTKEINSLAHNKLQKYSITSFQNMFKNAENISSLNDLSVKCTKRHDK